MPSAVTQAPRFTSDQAACLARELFGLDGALSPLPSERDQNFLISGLDGPSAVLKIANAGEERRVLELQHQALDHVRVYAPDLAVPQVLAARNGATLVPAAGPDGRMYFIRALTYVPGTPLASARPHGPELLFSLGERLAAMDKALATFRHPAMRRDLPWDLRRTGDLAGHLARIADHDRRMLVARIVQRFDTEVGPRLAGLRASVIHNDWNDHNVLVRRRSDAEFPEVAGVVDFGDLLYSHAVCDLAIAAAYAMLGKPDPLAAAADVLSGFVKRFPLEEAEIDVLFDLIRCRLAISVTLAAVQKAEAPSNDYLTVSETEAWALLEELAAVPAGQATAELRLAAGWGTGAAAVMPQRMPAGIAQPGRPARDSLAAGTLLARRRALIGPSLRLAYRAPLVIARGRRQFLFDHEGRPYLDAVNNVAHVGHCHPRVVRAGQAQMAVLNTNTRYLHPYLVDFAERLIGTLPAPLTVCYVVNSGSEANELALRLARTHTRHRDIVVLEGGYHGNTSSLVDISPYKFDGPGGQGCPPHVVKVPVPDPYRGRYRGSDASVGACYAREIAAAVAARRAQGRSIAAFIAESLPSCAGQIVPPQGFLAEAYASVRAAGGVCIADEVQVGLGRVGSHFWGFETQDVVPDIVTIGKPIGNGHPLGAVVTTPEIAASFDNGMEYFNTFGGNPVSCTIGLAVLDVIRDEGLQDHARLVGARLLAGLRDLQRAHPIVGDVRGRGLFLGIELVEDRDSLAPATRQATHIVNRLRELGVLVSSDGPFDNVIKIKPPLVFTAADADRLVEVLDRVLREEGARSPGP